MNPETGLNFPALCRLWATSFRRLSRSTAGATAFVLASSFCWPSVYARTPGPTDVPLERLLANAETFIAKNPEKPEGYHIIGRIHHLAFLRGCEVFPVIGGEMDDKKRPAVPEDPFARVDAARDWEAEGRASKKLGLGGMTIFYGTKLAQRYTELTRKYEEELTRNEWVPNVSLSWSDRLGHADKAVKNFREAMRLDPHDCLYPLALASFAEDFGRTLDRNKIAKLPSNLSRFSAKEVRDLYRLAFTLAAPPEHDWQKLADRFKAGEPIGFRSEDFTVYPEAGTAFVRVATRDGVLLSKEEQVFLRVAKDGLAKRQEFDKRNPGLISPIIFSLAEADKIECLLLPKADVGFDLSGYGGDERWPWVQPTTCFLVWDPRRTGRITSARQMFGTYTFGIPWQNGYRALAALDDNGDGMLSDSELHGLAVWIDSNGDAISQSDEVTGLEEAGIDAIMVHETTFDGIHPMHPRGITLRDGRRIPTWDWMVTPHRSK